MEEAEAAALQLDNCPMRMAALPGGRVIILALAGGGLLQVSSALPSARLYPSLDRLSD